MDSRRITWSCNSKFAKYKEKKKQLNPSIQKPILTSSLVEAPTKSENIVSCKREEPNDAAQTCSAETSVSVLGKRPDPPTGAEEHPERQVPSS